MADPKRHIIIRDALMSDVSSCLHLDHSYETDYVWQVKLLNTGQQRTIDFREERLPRRMEVTYTPQQQLLTHALNPQHCFLVAADPDNNVLGYLVMLKDALTAIAQLKAIAIDKPHRERNIAQRLLAIAQQWAQQHHIRRILAETQTKNVPTITLYQQAGYTFCGFNDQYFTNRDIAVFFSLTIR